MAGFSAAPGQPEAPEASFQDGDGETRRLSEFRGRLVLVNLWATWCAPCVREMPSLDALQAELAGEGLTVLPVSLDRGGAQVVRPFYEEHGLENLPVLADRTGGLFRTFAVRGVPTSVLIGREGQVLGRLEGDADWHSPEALALVRHFLECGRPAAEGG
ncbi:MAG: TlpA disulfide reductase family protein [Acetobacterales bacterium]